MLPPLGDGGRTGPGTVSVGVVEAELLECRQRLTCGTVAHLTRLAQVDVDGPAGPTARIGDLAAGAASHQKRHHHVLRQVVVLDDGLLGAGAADVAGVAVCQIGDLGDLGR